MKKTLFILSLLVCTFISQAQEELKNSEVSTYYFIRHAEKVISEDPNPKLDSLGELRAEQWAEIFKNISFDAVYSTDYIRTRNTATPTVESQGLELILYHPVNIDYTTFLVETRGKIVLVVGHSNTIPAFVNKLIGTEKYKLIEHDNYGNLYIVEITVNAVTDKLLYLN